MLVTETQGRLYAHAAEATVKGNSPVTLMLSTKKLLHHEGWGSPCSLHNVVDATSHQAGGSKDLLVSLQDSKGLAPWRQIWFTLEATHKVATSCSSLSLELSEMNRVFERRTLDSLYRRDSPVAITYRNHFNYISQSCIMLKSNMSLIII